MPAIIAFVLIDVILDFMIFKTDNSVPSAKAPPSMVPRVVLDMMIDDISVALKASFCMSPMFEL